MAAQLSRPRAASTPKPQRQLLSSINSASGVAVASKPRPLMLITRPDTAVNRAAGKYRPMNTVHTRNAGAQPLPISTCPSSSQPKLGASADITPPTTATGKAQTMVRRTPNTSIDTPITSCISPKEK